MALRINAENFEEKVLKADKPVLVDFYSDTCIPCKQMAGILGDIEDENEDDIYIYKVNVNYDKALAEEFKVMSAPTVICFVNGEQKGKVVGLKEPEEIEAAVAAENEDGNGLIDLPYRLDHVKARDVRHLNIGDDDIRFAFIQPVQRAFRVSKGLHLPARMC